MEAIGKERNWQQSFQKEKVTDVRSTDKIFNLYFTDIWPILAKKLFLGYF